MYIPRIWDTSIDNIQHNLHHQYYHPYQLTVTYPEEKEEEYDSDWAMSTDSEEETAEEMVELSADNFQYVYANVLDRRESYDSRCEEGYEGYEYDDFVVDNEEEGSEGEDGGSVSSEITLVLENGKEGRSEDEDGESEVEDGKTKRKISIVSHSSPTSTTEKSEEAEERKPSITSTRSGSSTSSGLFVSEHPSNNPPPKATPSLLATRKPFLNLRISDSEPEDIAEEIADAITLFSRRCNRNRAPLRLRLSREMLQDEEVLEALELAGKLELARGMEIGDEEGSLGWVLGPKGQEV
jgi:hypothetical protein